MWFDYEMKHTQVFVEKQFFVETINALLLCNDTAPASTCTHSTRMTSRTGL